MKKVPQSVDSLPPPSVEWRRESDNERRERLERAGILNSGSSQSPMAGKDGIRAVDPSASVPKQFMSQAEEHKEKAKKQFAWWWGVDLARWHAIRSPRDTQTITDGSFGLSAELTHPEWRIGSFQIGFGPKAVFYHGGQYAKLDDSLFQGTGYAKFVSSEVGLSALFTQLSAESLGSSRSFWSAHFYYLPVRWISAEPSSSANMISRSDTYSRTSLNLPGVGLQLASGYDWNSLLKAEVFGAVQAAWPLQYRTRLGLKFSMALINDDISFFGP